MHSIKNVFKGDHCIFSFQGDSFFFVKRKSSEYSLHTKEMKSFQMRQSPKHNLSFYFYKKYLSKSGIRIFL